MVKFITGNMDAEFFDFSSYTSNVHVTALGGNDIVVGTNFNDTIEGNTGDDELQGGAGKDVIFGGQGYDSILGGLGADSIYAGKGSDSIYAGAGNDNVFGGDGNDTIYGDITDFNEPWWAEATGADTLNGGNGSDVIFGGKGNDKLYGGAGHDELFGQSGSNALFGGAGADILHFGYSTTDVLTGGAGKDTFHLDFVMPVLSTATPEKVHATIKDFTASQDTLDLSDFVNYYPWAWNTHFQVSAATVAGVQGTLLSVVSDDLGQPSSFDDRSISVFLENYTHKLIETDIPGVFSGSL